MEFLGIWGLVPPLVLAGAHLITRIHGNMVYLSGALITRVHGHMVYLCRLGPLVLPLVMQHGATSATTGATSDTRATGATPGNIQSTGVVDWEFI